MKSNFYTRFAMVFATLLMFTYFASAQTTINVLVTDADDTMEETRDDETNPAKLDELAGFMDHGSSDLELCTEGDYGNIRQYVGVGFRNVQIPIGATITNAYIQFSSDSDEGADKIVSIDIWGVAEANTSLPILTEQFNLSSRPRTTAMVTGWSPGAWTAGDRGTDQQTPDLSAIITEIIALEGWVPGNNLMIQFTDDTTTLKMHREGISADAAIGAGMPETAPELFVTFTTGSGTAVNSTLGEFSSIYPNPTEGLLHIKNPSSGNYSFEIYTINGKLVASRRNISGPTTTVDVSGLAKGVYFVDIRNSERTGTHKLIVK